MANRIIDNFDIFRSHMTFEKARKFDTKTGNLETINDTYDRYIVHIIKRAKDASGKSYGVNESNRLIKTFEIGSLEYFDKKREVIIDLCRSNGARAYILPQVRSTYDCLKELTKICVDNLENPTVKFQHLLRSCLCAMHKSRDKKWILDLDSDSMTEYSVLTGFPRCRLTSCTWEVDEVLEIVQDELISCGKNPDDAYVVETKNGCHIITSPFNLQAAYRKCGLFFEGERRLDVGNAVGAEELNGKTSIIGWLHKDGMSLLYMECED